ncbi:hypothetical protein L6164_025562 [Bauhinia variegata]|uniref:Uncharacterized protein n=1 Tax=Bauhinia variegata TaxID=167791 RepID=A0ACB9M0V0_BAUVA|nr:hypothetical protein L6164_025562 [Bauhinia variegata]
MARGSDEDLCDDDDAVLAEETTSKKQRLADPGDEALTALSLREGDGAQPTPGEVHAPPQGSQPFPTLPPELLVEVLSRLPVKSLLQLRCVCKSWKSLISDPQFVKKHLQMSVMDPKFTHHKLIFQFSKRSFTLKYCSVYSIFNYSSTRAAVLKYPTTYRGYDMIVGSCNGLLCFANKQKGVLLCNPSMRTLKESPFLGNEPRVGSYTVYGFGYDHLNDCYKVVAIFCYSEGRNAYKTDVKVYTLGTSYWRRILEFPVVPYDDTGKFVSGTGTINWVGKSTTGSRYPWVIVSLDLGKETYQEVLQPDYEVGLVVSLGVLRDCLCICHYYNTHLDLWLMKDCGLTVSWTKLVTIHEDITSFKPLCTSEIGEILSETVPNFNIGLYDPRDSKVKHPEIKNIKGWVEAEVYVESLVSPCS